MQVAGEYNGRLPAKVIIVVVFQLLKIILK